MRSSRSILFVRSSWVVMIAALNKYVKMMLAPKISPINEYLSVHHIKDPRHVFSARKRNDGIQVAETRKAIMAIQLRVANLLRARNLSLRTDRKVVSRPNISIVYATSHISVRLLVDWGVCCEWDMYTRPYKLRRLSASLDKYSAHCSALNDDEHRALYYDCRRDDNREHLSRMDFWPNAGRLA